MKTEKIETAEMILGDNMEIMERYPDKYFELAIVDPPYFKGVANGGFYGKAVSSTGVERHTKKDEHWDSGIPDERYFKELLRVSKNQIIWGANYFNCFSGPMGAIIWDKKNDTSTFSNCEIASQTFSKGVFVFRYLWDGMKQEAGEREQRIHISQKPVALYKWLLSRYARTGDKILDTHGGSGSSVIACIDLGFPIVWIEKDAGYYDSAVSRVKTFALQPKLFDIPVQKEEQKTLFEAESE
jgi:site-specific DNA-methyltransferase (adenine-specific)